MKGVGKEESNRLYILFEPKNSEREMRMREENLCTRPDV